MIEEILYEYDNTLIGRYDEISSDSFFNGEVGGPNERLAINCVKYAIEKIMQWDEDTAIARFDEYMIRILRLEKVVSYIDYPPELPLGSPKYILSLIYPRKVRLNQRQMVIETLESVLSDDRGQFPRDYFVGGIGFKRFCYCIKHLLEVYKPMNSIEELYQFFASSKGNEFLAIYRLKIPSYQYSIDIFEVLRHITQNSPDGELYYCKTTFDKQYQSILDKEKKALKSKK